MRTLRNIFQKKGRATLTIFGVSIGVFALVVMGAMAEKLTLLVDGGTRYYSDKVSVSGEGGVMGLGVNPIPLDKIPEIEAIPGVQVAQAEVSMMLDEEMSAVNMGPPPMLMGSDQRGEEYESFEIDINGRTLTIEDRGKALVGSDLVKKLNAKLGGTITIRGREFEVVGIMDKTLTSPDTSIMIPLPDIQEILHSTLPALIRESLTPEQLITSITVFTTPGTDPDTLAEKIEEEVDEITTLGPAAFKKQVSDSVGIFSTIIYAVALISLLIGGLSVVNTMSMSVAERTREIGIRKAVGASDGNIIVQFVLESATIGLIAGLVGLLLGYLMVTGLNAGAAESGNKIFLITPRLLAGSLGFSLFLGTLSGLLPAWRAARLNPVDALSYE